MSNGNVAWLTIGAERMLAGQAMSTHIYETNPPLSIIIYIPVVLIAKLIGIPAATINPYLSFLLCCLSLFAVTQIIKKFEFLNDNNRKSLLIGYFTGITIYTALFFGDREHLIILALFPFVLCQICLNEKIKLKKNILLPCMTAGALLVLIKPHYGLIPVAIMLERLWREKKLTALFKIDFFMLALTTIGYLLILVTFFNDYLTIIFPDVYKLYVNSYDLSALFNLLKTSSVLFLSFLAIELFEKDIPKEKRKFLLRLYICAILSLIPFIVQMKGFYNHIIPAYVFFMAAMPLTVNFRMNSFKEKWNSLGLVIPVISILMLTNAINPPNREFPNQEDLKKLPVTKFLQENCPQPCTFFAFHGDIEIFNPTAAHLGYVHGTRFPAHWFLPGILDKIHNGAKHDQDEGQILLEKYAKMVLEDLNYYKPDLILLQNNLNKDQGNIVDFKDTYKINTKIIDTLETQYEYITMFSFDRAKYFSGTILNEEMILKYDVYKRKKKSDNI